MRTKRWGLPAITGLYGLSLAFTGYYRLFLPHRTAQRPLSSSHYGNDDTEGRDIGRGARQTFLRSTSDPVFVFAHPSSLRSHLAPQCLSSRIERSSAHRSYIFDLGAQRQCVALGMQGIRVSCGCLAGFDLPPSVSPLGMSQFLRLQSNYHLPRHHRAAHHKAPLGVYGPLRKDSIFEGGFSFCRGVHREFLGG